MIMMYLLFVFSLVFIRFFAGYDSRFLTGKYIVINDRKLRMLLIDEMSFFERRKRPEKDINKMTVSGFIFYIFSIVTLVISVLLHFLVPKTPVEPWEIETEEFFMYVDTLNEKLSAICIWLFFLSVIWCLTVRMIRYTKIIERKWIRILTYRTSFIMFAAVILITFEMIKEFVVCFI